VRVQTQREASRSTDGGTPAEFAAPGPAPAEGPAELRRRRSVSLSSWVVASAGAWALILVTQVSGRGGLAWDEATRVAAGQRLNLALRAHDPGQVVEWLKAQTVYPFIEPGLHGLALYLGASSLAAAWLPSTLAFIIAGLLAAALVHQLGGNRLTVGMAAALVWLCPINVRLAAGGFTENLGACVLLAVVLVLVRMVRAPSWPHAVGLAVLLGCAWGLKYPYGILATGVVVISAVATVGWSRELLRRYLPVLALGLLLTGAHLGLNWHQRSVAFGRYTGQPGARYLDFGYYLRALFFEHELDLQPVVAVFCLVGLAPRAGAWRRRPEVRPVVIAVVVWFLMYSVVQTKIPRIAGLVLPLLLTAAVAGFVEAYTRLAASSTSVRTRVVVTACCVVLLGTQLAMQASSLDTRLWFLDPDASALEAMAFVDGQLGTGPGPLLMIGPVNRLSPPAVQLAWDDALQGASPGVQTVQRTEGSREEDVWWSLRAFKPSRVIGIDIRPGASFERTADYPELLSDNRAYISFARVLERRGVFRRIAETSLERGRLQVLVWELTDPAALDAAQESVGDEGA
jgi:hypothetical protein